MWKRSLLFNSGITFCCNFYAPLLLKCILPLPFFACIFFYLALFQAWFNVVPMLFVSLLQRSCVWLFSALIFCFFLGNKKAVCLSVHCLFQHPKKWFIPVFSSWIKLIISWGCCGPIFDKPTRAWRRSRYSSCLGHKHLSMYLNVIKLAVVFMTMHLFISCQVYFYVT